MTPEAVMAEVIEEEWRRGMLGIGNGGARDANGSRAGDGADGQRMTVPAPLPYED